MERMMQEVIKEYRTADQRGIKYKKRHPPPYNIRNDIMLHLTQKWIRSVTEDIHARGIYPKE
jgi:hypothetical protein